jgi:hypothetical protein
MRFVEVGQFDVVHRQVAWPWIVFDAKKTRIAFGSSKDAVATRALVNGALESGPTFDLPDGLGLPTQRPPANGHRGAASGAHGFAIDSNGARLAVVGTTKDESVLVTMSAGGEERRTKIAELCGGDFVAHAAAFDRSGKRLWISAESEKETAIVLVEADSHALVGVLKSAAFPPPSVHELHVHPQDDAVLLLAACGQDGTFARVAGFTDGPPVEVKTALDDGSMSCGLVGFSMDAARVHLVEDFALRTHAWPGLEELSNVELADEFASTYSGIVTAQGIFVDGTDADSGEGDVVMSFDDAALTGTVLKPPFPTGMWAGRLGADCLVTVESKGDPAKGRVLRLATAAN